MNVHVFVCCSVVWEWYFFIILSVTVYVMDLNLYECMEYLVIVLCVPDQWVQEISSYLNLPLIITSHFEIHICSAMVHV